MLSKILKNIALILEDTQTLENISEWENDNATELQITTQTYISLVNFVLANIAENFLCYRCTQDLVSDNTGKLYLADLRFTPCRIKHIRDENFKIVKYNVGIDYIFVSNPNSVHFIEYAYIPPDVSNLEDSILLPIGLDYKTLCYGAVSEYYSLKMQFTQANIWEQKFKSGLKNLGLSYKETRLASRRWL